MWIQGSVVGTRGGESRAGRLGVEDELLNLATELGFVLVKSLLIGVKGTNAKKPFGLVRLYRKRAVAQEPSTSGFWFRVWVKSSGTRTVWTRVSTGSIVSYWATTAIPVSTGFGKRIRGVRVLLVYPPRAGSVFPDCSSFSRWAANSWPIRLPAWYVSK